VSIIAYIIVLAILGLIVGGLGRLLLPGPDPMSVMQTIIVGIVSSYASGLFIRYVLDRRSGFSLLLAVIFSMLIVWLVRRYRQSSWAQPGPPGVRRP
jgi:uncharacterized membrane protein YeaQ/YmgE (transglycosylase-associated protein family)